MKIVVFGGGGFIGSTIVDRLLSEGHSVKVFERPGIPQYRKFDADESIEWTTGDLLCKYDVGLAIEGSDAVLHLVSTTLPKNSNDDPIYDIQSNLVASIQILDAMVSHKVKKIVFISSGGTVYGKLKYIPVDEGHPTDPEVSYGITKLAIEKYLLMYNHLHGIKPVILRVANPYGERQRVETAQGAIGVFLHRTLNGLPIEIWGDGSVQRDFLHVSDVADAFSKAIDYQGDSFVFNISSGIGTSLSDLLKLIAESHRSNPEVIYRPGRPFDVPISILCNKLAQKELGWKPNIEIREGIHRTYKWMANSLKTAIR